MKKTSPCSVITEPLKLIEIIENYVDRMDLRRKPLLIWSQDVESRYELLNYFKDSTIQPMEVPLYGHEYAFIDGNPMPVHIKKHPELQHTFFLPSSYKEGIEGFYYRACTNDIYENASYLQQLVNKGFAVICSSFDNPSPSNNHFENVLFDASFPLLIMDHQVIKSLEEWLSWAEENGYLAEICDYLALYPEDFFRPTDVPGLTPEKWRVLNDGLKHYLPHNVDFLLKVGRRPRIYNSVGEIPDDILHNEVKRLGEVVGKRFVAFVKNRNH